MPERSFGRTVRYRRTKLGLSQAKLADLVGRSAATIRSWEAERSIPNDQKVLATLAAILGIDERTLFDKAGLERPVVEETSPTIEQELASLSPEKTRESPSGGEKATPRRPSSPPPPRAISPLQDLERLPAAPSPEVVTATTTHTVLTAVPIREASYVEDPTQRLTYHVRTLATVVVLVTLGIALLWAMGEGLESFGEWWHDFYSELRL